MKQRKKILVIDDDAADCDLTCRTLEPCGLEVITHRDARAGIEAAPAILPDLVFVKLLLPDTNGLKVSKAIHSVEALRHVPLVVIVSEHGELDPKYTTTIGIVDILVQPLRSSEIIAMVVSLLGEEALVDEDAEVPAESPDKEEVFQPDEEDTEDLENEMNEKDFIMRAYEKKTYESVLPDNMREAIDEASMPGQHTPQDAKEQDLFSRMGESTPRDKTELRDADDSRPSTVVNEAEGDYTVNPDDADLPASSLRRAAIVVASIAAGIAVGIGLYLFFTAGTPRTPAQKQIKEVLPAPAAVLQTVPSSPSAQPGAIPEIPVKEEPSSSAKAARTEPASQESVEAGKASRTGSAIPPAKTTPAKGRMNGVYTVQAGVFGKKGNADALAEKITAIGITASVEKIEGTGVKTVYRVTAGAFATRAEADQASENLKKKGVATIVRKK